MAQIDFYAGENFTIANLSGSGLGFYGATFGQSVAVGEYQGTTYITNSAGTANGPQCDNVKYLNIGSGIVGSSSSGIPLTSIPNYQATLNPRFTHTSPVNVQNATWTFYDRNSTNNNPSGVTVKAAEIIHPNTSQADIGGSGDTTWISPVGSSLVMDLVDSPGLSGLSPNGVGTVDMTHDWYIAISVSPDSIGSKTFAGFLTCEYL